MTLCKLKMSRVTLILIKDQTTFLSFQSIFPQYCVIFSSTWSFYNLYLTYVLSNYTV